MPGPLEGITVVKVATSVAGPYATLILSQLGARVVKVERPTRVVIEARGWKPPSIGDGGVMFAVMNAGKHGVVADLDNSADQEKLQRLVDTADVFVTSLREESLRKCGLDVDSLQQRHPALVYALISAFGTDGPLAGEPGYEPLVQAFVGLMAVTGEEGRTPVRDRTSIIDMDTGMWTAIAVLAALEERRRTGRGARLDLSLLETGVAWLPHQIASRQAEGREPRRFGSASRCSCRTRRSRPRKGTSSWPPATTGSGAGSAPRATVRTWPTTPASPPTHSASSGATTW